MFYIASIKEGINTVHKNWQLIVVQCVSMVLSFMGLFIIVGIPIAIAFIMFGLDLTEILRLKDLTSAFKGSAELLHKYFAMAIVIMLSLLLYLVFIIVLWVFTLSGTIGILKNEVLNKGLSGHPQKVEDFWGCPFGGPRRFSMKTFFAEGKSFFLPAFLFSAIIGAAFILLAFMLGILGGGASAIIEMAKTQEATLALFLGVFFSLLILSVGIFLIIVTLSITTYGIAHLAFNRHGVFETFKGTVKYLYSKPSSVGFYAVLLLGYMVIGFLVILIGSPLTLIPVIGPILALPYQLITYAIQGYLSLVMLSSIFHYYYKTGYFSPLRAPQKVKDHESIEGSDTSQTIDAEQAPLPDERVENQQE